jgi:hypothetical protein
MGGADRVKPETGAIQSGVSNARGERRPTGAPTDAPTDANRAPGPMAAPLTKPEASKA